MHRGLCGRHRAIEAWKTGGFIRRIASIGGKLYQLVELDAAEVLLISEANGYEDPARFIARHENWRSTLNAKNVVQDSSPVVQPKIKSKPGADEQRKRGRPPSSKEKIALKPAKKRKRGGKYGFERLRQIGDQIFIKEEAARVGAAASYYATHSKPKRKVSVRKAEVGGELGVIVELLDILKPCKT